MRFGKLAAKTLAVVGALSLSLASFSLNASAASVANGQESTYLVVYSSPDKVNTNTVQSHGHKIAQNLNKAGVLIVKSKNPDDLKKLPGVTGVAKDRMRIQIPAEQGQIVKKDALNPQAATADGCASTKASCPTQWDLDRIHLPKAWEQTQGSPGVKVAVLDTGLTSTHEEVGANYDKADSASFVQPNDSCSADADTYNSIEDFQGHGTWTATHVAGINGSVMTGIAPKTTLINVRVLGACGTGADSWILNGMLYGNQVGAAIESMSLGGYLCGLGTVPGSNSCATAAQVGEDQTVYQAYVQVIQYLKAHGTLVVAAAGNDHVQLDRRGMVVSHGSLAKASQTANPLNDLYGLTEAPGGVPGVIAVSALNRQTAQGKAGETVHGQFGIGSSDQLAYYSSYGQRIDVSAPGGARNYNVPRFDCAPNVLECQRLEPSAPGKGDNPGDFGAWGVDANGQPCNNCYESIQGTSMATPQVAGVAALFLARHPTITPDLVSVFLHVSVTNFQNPNATPAIASDPSLPTYNYDLYYHGKPIPNNWMGYGVIDAAAAVRF